MTDEWRCDQCGKTYIGFVPYRYWDTNDRYLLLCAPECLQLWLSANPLVVEGES